MARVGGGSQAPAATVEPQQRGFPTSTNGTGVPATVGPRPMVLVRYRAGETVTPGEGIPCTVCVLTHVTDTAVVGL
jgi:hypothetical protein